MTASQRGIDPPSAAFKAQNAENLWEDYRTCILNRLGSGREPILHSRIIVGVKTLELGAACDGMNGFQVEVKEAARMPLRALMLMDVQERGFHKGE